MSTLTLLCSRMKGARNTNASEGCNIVSTRFICLMSHFRSHPILVNVVFTRESGMTIKVTNVAGTKNGSSGWEITVCAFCARHLRQVRRQLRAHIRC